MKSRSRRRCSEATFRSLLRADDAWIPTPSEPVARSYRATGVSVHIEEDDRRSGDGGDSAVGARADLDHAGEQPKQL